MRVLNAQELKILLPVRPLFLQRRIAEAALDPRGHAAVIQARLLHVVQIFTAGDRAATKCPFINGTKKGGFLARFDLRPYEIAHRKTYHGLRPIGSLGGVENDEIRMTNDEGMTKLE